MLEFAAKAAGIGPLDFDYASRESHGMYFGPRLPMPQGVVMAAMHTYWRPEEDDGDSMRLAAATGLQVNFNYRTGRDERAGVGVWISGDTSPFPSFWTADAKDINAVARQTILRAAATIGKAMP